MNKEEQILKLLENNMGIITTEEIVRNNINRVFLTRLVKKGKIERIKKGLYVLSSTWGDEYFNLIYGNNGMGKTNLVEAICVLALTRSFRFFRIMSNCAC